MPDLSTTRMESARSHYPINYRTNQAIPYRQIISSDSQIYRRSIVSKLLSIFYLLLDTSYEYTISATFTRQHCNPPIWDDYHYHDFQVTVTVVSPCSTNDLYGVDMVEAENILKEAIATIPQKINHLPSCPNGTTEQLCNYFSNAVKFSDRKIKIKSVSVSETANRITCLRQSGVMSKRQKFLLATCYLLLATFLLLNYV